MIALYIIGGIVAYLLIGAVVVGVIIQIDVFWGEDELYILLAVWPVLIVLAAFYLPAKAAIRLAKRIGGVKD